MRINTLSFTLILAIIIAIVATVLAFIFVVPNRKNRLGKIGAFLHDAFQFKFLIIEKILQAFYILSTVLCITSGIAMLFGFTYYYSEYFEQTYFKWYGGY